MEIKPVLKSSYFSDYLKPAQVIFDLKSKDKVEAIEELLDLLARQRLIDNKKLILTRIIDRENLVSTAIGSGVALPHARVDTGGAIAVAAGRSETCTSSPRSVQRTRRWSRRTKPVMRSISLPGN